MSDFITIKYKLNKNEEKIKLFGPGFIWKNNDKCKILYKNQKFNLTQNFYTKDFENDELEIKLYIN